MSIRYAQGIKCLEQETKAYSFTPAWQKSDLLEDEASYTTFSGSRLKNAFYLQILFVA